MFFKVFGHTLFWNSPDFGHTLFWNSLEFSGFLLVRVLIMLEKIILDREKSYLVDFENFHIFQFLAKICQKWPISEKTIRLNVYI